MKAISLWQPWASAIALLGKSIETRSWSTKYRGPLAILATVKTPRQDLDAAFSDPVILSFFVNRNLVPVGYEFPEKHLPHGAVVATCNLVDCVPVETVRGKISPLEHAFGNYCDGRFAWMLRDVIKLAQPIPMKGKQGLFEITLDIPDLDEYDRANIAAARDLLNCGVYDAN